MRISLLVKTDLPCALKRECCNIEVECFAGCVAGFAALSVSTLIFSFP